ncbi:hypothetical protein ACO0LD_19485 [Undibacterium sp. Ji83W]|uniref:hypothetical protein n=1 Tax=Undibacterium sp. Ji83W TaxID=3413043 RepID=UPI003BF40DFD
MKILANVDALANLSSTAMGNPAGFFDSRGLDIMAIENGPTTGNPIGHTAIAVTGGGVYSFGNGTDLGSSVADYLAREANRRNTDLYIIKTSS